MRSYTLLVPSKTNPTPDRNGQSLYPFPDQNGAKTLPFRAAHTLYGLYKRVPSPRLVFHLLLNKLETGVKKFLDCQNTFEYRIIFVTFIRDLRLLIVIL